jgi:hypothetical protein
MNRDRSAGLLLGASHQIFIEPGGNTALRFTEAFDRAAGAIGNPQSAMSKFQVENPA